jgi:hypothetical protein
MQNAARVQWEDAQLWIFEEEDFLVNLLSRGFEKPHPCIIVRIL